MENESAKELWESFQQQIPNLPEQYDVWSFGDSKELADKSAALVLAGLKTATCSLKRLYDIEGADLPRVGIYSVILDGDGQAVGIIQNLEVFVFAFDEVTEDVAIAEGDRTVDYWTEAHKEFFKRECQSTGESFSTKMEVVFERFELVYAA
ncbi:ASCH domain-containing protein [Desemzia sp. RIT804]|uniref:ASCH domain-containing protein n=1 Tax=Desemzia sp. RIT 804 TaxID=2810209 RepID=UPI001951F69C|nr:ASCH domain-containing protein [Desemzia sp. RIT 804]MBM6614600.1 ASCH domain-containing protein [Desemzia sp. RIT 804]